jgi:hypothetical protein
MKHITHKVVLSCTTEKRQLVFTMTQVKKDSQNEIPSKILEQFNIPEKISIYLRFWYWIKKVYLDIIVGVIIGILILGIQKFYF